jgi:cysteine desulfurase
VGAGPAEIVFTSGGTEAANLAIFGVAAASPRTPAHVVTTAIEHPAVLAACGQTGLEVTYVAPAPNGVVDPDDIRHALRPNTVLVSAMHANNETGVLQPVAEIARIAHAHGALFHSDGVQAAGKIPVDVNETGADLYSISAHKFGALKGTGALYVRSGVKIAARQFGGRHERSRRAGTENVPGLIAMGAAARQAIAPVAALRDRLEQGILARVPDVAVNGAGTPRVPNTTNLCFEGIEGEPMVIALDLKGFAVSTGSACSSGSVEPSHVLMAMGLGRDRAKSSVRFSLGPSNTAAQADALVEAVAQCASHLRRLSPVYAGAGR